MNKTIKIYIVILIMALTGLLFFEANKPIPVNWNPTYSVADKIPLGLYIFKEELLEKKNGNIVTYSETPFEFLKENKVNNDQKITFLSVCNNGNSIDKTSINSILNQVEEGNNAFFSSNIFNKALLDTLKIKSKEVFSDSIWVSISDKTLERKIFELTKGSYKNVFKVDTDSSNYLVEVLGNRILIDDSKEINFLKVRFGKGFVYLHSEPQVFSNYHLLKDDHYQYAEVLLSYFDDSIIYWNIDRKDQDLTKNFSPLRFISSQPSLKSAWYLLLIIGLIFMFFGAKRKQRIIPIIKKLNNTTVDFTKTISNLYFQSNNHQDIYQKKINYLLEKIRTKYRVETDVLDHQFLNKLHLKSGVSYDDLNDIFSKIVKYKSGNINITELDLIALNKAIEKANL